MKKQFKILCIAVSLLLLLMSATACKEPETDYEWYAYAMRKTIKAQQIDMTLEMSFGTLNGSIIVLLDIPKNSAFAEITYTASFSQVWYIGGIRYLNQHTKHKEISDEFLYNEIYNISEYRIAQRHMTDFIREGNAYQFSVIGDKFDNLFSEESMLGNYMTAHEQFACQRVDFVMMQDLNNYIDSIAITCTYLTEDNTENTFYVKYNYHSLDQPVTINPPEDVENYIEY